MTKYKCCIIIFFFQSFSLFIYGQDLDHAHDVNYTQYLSIDDVSNYSISTQIGEYFKENMTSSMFIIGSSLTGMGGDASDGLENQPGFGAGFQSAFDVFLKNVGPKNFKLSGSYKYYPPTSFYSRVGGRDYLSTNWGDGKADFKNDTPNYNYSVSLKLFNFLKIGLEERNMKLHTYDAGSYIEIDGEIENRSDPIGVTDEKYRILNLGIKNLTFWRQDLAPTDRMQLFGSLGYDEEQKSLDFVNSFFVTGISFIPFINVNNNIIMDYWTVSSTFLLRSGVGNLWLKPEFSNSVDDYYQSIEIMLDLYPLITMLPTFGMQYGDYNRMSVRLQDDLFSIDQNKYSAGGLIRTGPVIKYLKESPYSINPDIKLEDLWSVYYTVNMIIAAPVDHFYGLIDWSFGFNDFSATHRYLFDDVDYKTFYYKNLFQRISINLGVLW